MDKNLLKKNFIGITTLIVTNCILILFSIKERRVAIIPFQDVSKSIILLSPKTVFIKQYLFTILQHFYSTTKSFSVKTVYKLFTMP